MRIVCTLAMVGLLSACAQPGPVQLYAGHAQSVSQEVSLHVPVELEIRSINGQPYTGANLLFGANDKTLKLKPGAYQVNAYYKNGFDVDGGISHEIVRGRTAIFTFEAKAGETWALDFDRPEHLAEAKTFTKQFDAWAHNITTDVKIKAEQGGYNASLLGGMGAGERPAEAASIEPLAQPLTLNQAPVATLPHDEATLSTLKQLWNLSSPESRAAFLQWAQP